MPGAIAAERVTRRRTMRAERAAPAGCVGARAHEAGSAAVWVRPGRLSRSHRMKGVVMSGKESEPHYGEESPEQEPSYGEDTPRAGPPQAEDETEGEAPAEGVGP